MKRSEAFPSRYVSKDDVEIPVVWMIASVVCVEMDDDAGGKKNPPVMHFKNPESKALILNNSNWMTIEDLYGGESDAWTDCQIELFKDPSVMFGGKRVGGVRVRKPATVNPLDELRAAFKRVREQLKANHIEVEPLFWAQVKAMSAEQLQAAIAKADSQLPA